MWGSSNMYVIKLGNFLFPLKLQEDIIYMPTIIVHITMECPLLVYMSASVMKARAFHRGAYLIPHPLHLIQDLAHNGSSFHGG